MIIATSFSLVNKLTYEDTDDTSRLIDNHESFLKLINRVRKNDLIIFHKLETKTYVTRANFWLFLTQFGDWDYVSISICKTIKAFYNMFQYHDVMKLNVSDNDIIWPGNVPQKPEGLIIPTFLKVMTIDEQPFVYARRVQDESECSSVLEEEPCPWFNNTGSGIRKHWNRKCASNSSPLASVSSNFPLTKLVLS